MSKRRPTTTRNRKRPARKVGKDSAFEPAPAVQKSSVGAETVLYVHGIGNKPPASVLKAQWDMALFEFDLGERSRMAYWVDRERYPAPEAGVASGGDYADDNGSAPTGAFSPKAVRENWNGRAELKSLDAEIIEILGTHGGRARTSNQARRLRGLAATLLAENAMVDDDAYEAIVKRQRGQEGAVARRIQAQRYGAAAVEAKVFGFLPRPMRQWITRSITRTFLRDVNDLFVDKIKGEKMRESVRERLRVGGGPFVIVAHSQGTMVAYTVLMEEEFKDIDVRLFVTIGSPLAIKEVQDFISDLTKQSKLMVPPGVKRWVNVCDPLDPVALNKKLAGQYVPNALKTTIQDHLQFNPDSLRHPHSATGYLALEQVREPVRSEVNTGLFQPVAAFAMARDVVRAFADAGSNDRHRILVQLADFATTEVNRDGALARIYELLGAKSEESAKRALLDPEELERYVALNLTRNEAELLGSKALGEKKFPVARIWKNSAKWAYIDRSIHTTQAHPAHNSYHAEGADVTWAVLDSGIHWRHPHFGPNAETIARVYDCTDPTQRRGRQSLRQLDRTNGEDALQAQDRYGHGAHVAGIIAGCVVVPDKDGKERRMCGMAPKAKLVIYKVLDNNGSGEDSWIIKAIDHIFDTNERAGRIVIHGVNLSLGGEFDVEAFNCGHTPLCVELRRLWRQGVVVVLAAGNEGFASLSASNGDAVQANMGMSLGDPANLEEAIVVGSVHKDRPHTYGASFFSSRGPTADGRMKPDCVAPGERIFSVRNDASIKVGATFDELYTEMSGTSMAAPHVSGLIAAFLSKRQEFIGDPDRIKQILLSNCTDLQRQRNMQGAGMPNLIKMLVNV